MLAELKNYKLNKLFIIITIILSMIFLGVQFRFFMYLAFVILCGVAIFLSDKEGFYLLFFLMPFCSVFIPGKEQTSFYTYFEIFFVFALFVRSEKKDYDSIFLFFTYAATVFAFSFMRLRYDLSIKYILKHILNIILLYLFTLQKLNKEDSIRLIKYYIIGVFLSSLMGLLRLNWKSLQDLVGELMGYNNGSLRFSGLYKDPNMYTALLFSAIIPVLILNAKRQISWIWAVISFCCMLLGFLTDSKSFLLICMIVVLYYGIQMLISKQYKMLITLFSVGVFLVFFLEIRYQLVSSIISRFGEGFNINNITTGRFNIWINYLKTFVSDLNIFIFGAGVGAPKPNGYEAHNIIIEIIYNFGIFGGAILIFLLKLIFVAESNNFNRRFSNYFTLFVMSTLFFFLSGIMLYEMAFYYIICYLMYNINIDNQEEQLVLKETLY